MITIHWEPVFSVGVKELDEEHKQLIAFMNEVYERLEKDAHAGGYSDFFEKLKKHAEDHFRNEERYFAAFAYPDAAAHVSEHEKIKTGIDELERAFDANPSTAIIFEALRFLDDWLFDHVMLFDKKYTEHFNKHGLS